MNFGRHQFIPLAAALAAVTLVTLSGHGASSQTTRTIKIIVPNPPGGVGDFLARLLVEQISRTHGPAMVVENRAGAGSVIGTEVVSHAAPDGNTVLITSTDLLAPHIQKSNYDPLSSLEPICYLVTVPEVIAVNSASPYVTLADLLNAARAKPGELTLASTGPETVLQLGFEMLKRAAKVDMTFVPYSGGAPMVNALLGEHVTSALLSYSTLTEQLKAGKLHALATATRTRIAPLPDVPTVAEFGYANYEIDYWIGLFAPAKTPKETVSKLAGWFSDAVQRPRSRQSLPSRGSIRQ